MKNLVRIQRVYFDVGATLVHPHPSVGEIYRKAGAPHGLTASELELETAFRQVWKRHTDSEGMAPLAFGRDEASTHDWWRRLVSAVLDCVDFDGDHEACFQSFFGAFEGRDAWRIYDDALPALEKLRARNVPIGILSNWDYRLPRLLDALELTHYFDIILVSALEALAKPDAKFFELACQRSGLRADQIAYIGDSVGFDLDPGLAAGMETYLIDRDSKCLEHSAGRGVQSLVTFVDKVLAL